MRDSLSAKLWSAQKRSTQSAIEEAAKAKMRMLPVISVEDALPLNDFGVQHRRYYLVQTYPGGQLFVATFGYEGQNWWVGTHGCILSEEYGYEVTHWCPLPYPSAGNSAKGR